MDALFKYFDSFLRLSPESKGVIASHLEIEQINKGDLFWKAGQRCSKLYFIKSGIARLFFYDETGEENTVHFVSAEQFITDLDSLNTRMPSSVSCIAATDCEAIVFTAATLEKFGKEVFEWNELSRKITEKTLFDKIKIRERIFLKEAKERYISFLEQFPSVANNVQANHIASYLGISQFTLSHIKKELTKADFLRIHKN